VLPLLQAYVPLPPAVRLAVGLEHVRMAETGVIVALGGVVLVVTEAVALAVQPLAVFVTVTEYELDEFTVIDAADAPVFHA